MKSPRVVLLASLAAAACAGPPAERPAAAAASPAASLPPGHPPVAPGAQAAPADATAQVRLSGTIDLAPALEAGPGDVLYVIARKGGATLLVRRIEKPKFPFEFELADADAMVSGIALEGPVELVARLSRTGDAIPSKGDLEGVTQGVAIPAAAVRVTIDTTRP